MEEPRRRREGDRMDRDRPKTTRARDVEARVCGADESRFSQSEVLVVYARTRSLSKGEEVEKAMRLVLNLRIAPRMMDG
jgi:hypothetical protein